MRGRLYKLHARVLAEVFFEAFDEVCRPDCELPAHLTDFAWFVVPKKAGADVVNHVRDLECPNEDTKVLARMFTLILDRACAEQLRRRQQAFVSGGQVELNVIGISEATARAQRDPATLQCLLFLDYSKGFNMLSWEWLTAVLRHAGLPEQLVHGISSLMHRHTSYLCFSGNVHSPVTFLAGYSQGHPLSVFVYLLGVDPFLHQASCNSGVAHVWGFCDDWILDVTLQSRLEPIARLLLDFEVASGQVFNRATTAWMPNRRLTEVELHRLRCGADCQQTQNFGSLVWP